MTIRCFHGALAWPALLATLALGACADPPQLASTDQAAAGIINGEPISTDEFPSAGQIIFQGTLVMGEQSYPMTMPLCSGTLVATDVVMAAGHYIG